MTKSELIQAVRSQNDPNASPEAKAAAEQTLSVVRTGVPKESRLHPIAETR